MNERREQPLVYVVDDEPGNRLLARDVLEGQGFQVAEAADGATALAEIEALRPDLVLLDVMMPGLDGFAVCTELRRRPASAHVPVLMLTGLDDAESINRAYAVGATDFAIKPLQWALLGHRLRYLLRSAETLAALRESEARLTNAQRIARLGDWSLDLDTREAWYGRTTYTILGVDPAGPRLRYDDYLALVHPDDRPHLDLLAERLDEIGDYELEYRIVRRDGSTRFLHERGEVRRDDSGRPRRLDGIVHDITERRHAETQLRFLADHDPLTRLPNRQQLTESMATALARCRRQGHALAVLVLDLDQFKAINETLGHRSGDELLCGVADRLRAELRITDQLSRADELLGEATLARLGGDEFIVTMADIPGAETAARVAERLLGALQPPFQLGDREVGVTGTVGIAIFPQDGADPEGLLAAAGAAMHHAKVSSPGRFEYFDRSMNAAALRRMLLETALRRALDHDELQVHYQPVVDLERRVIGFEALLRWQHPELGAIPPGDFVPLAEEIGLIGRLGEWILLGACHRLAALRRETGRDLSVSVNVSPRQLQQPGFAAQVAAALAASGLPAAALSVEITESVMMDDQSAARGELLALRDLGARIAIDDFGTGFSSLGYLGRFPADSLKIDRGFVHDLPDSRIAAAIVASILAMARGLGIQVIAEGVETEAQEAFLLAHGCTHLQGFRFGRPRAAPLLELP